MAYLPNTTLIIRSNYGDESIALIQSLFENPAVCANFERIKVVYIDTGWAASNWQARVLQGQAWVEKCGFEAVCLTANTTFDALVRDRKNFPSAKFQWCAGFLKGLPLMSWLDEHDPKGEWVVALPKRQALYRQTLTEWIDECEFHGERRVWHPNLAMLDNERDQCIARAGFARLGHRSLECDPCINSHAEDLARLSVADQQKTQNLECIVGKKMFPVIKTATNNRENFSMGCGDPFGCGL